MSCPHLKNSVTKYVPVMPHPCFFCLYLASEYLELALAQCSEFVTVTVPILPSNKVFKSFM